jgi:hypothetical protein
VTREEYKTVRVNVLAATEIQRLYRGHLGRKKARRKREWEKAEPGPERLSMGLKLIGEGDEDDDDDDDDDDIDDNGGSDGGAGGYGGGVLRRWKW